MERPDPPAEGSAVARVGAGLLALRDGTADLHRRVEGVFPLATMDRAAYVAFLRGLASTFPAAEVAWTNAPGIADLVPDVAARRRADLLFADLEALGSTRPAAHAVPSVHDTAQALGVAYVLEGSALGARLLHRHVNTRLGLAPERGCAYLRAAARSSRTSWRDLCAAIELHAARHGSTATMTSSARSMFQSVATALEWEAASCRT